MPRANRYYMPGYVWHITHRCHKKEFLLKFSRDRKRWLEWLFEAKKRYGIKILNYMVTSNHVHLLVVDGGGHDVIPKSLQLIAGRRGQEYNQRKKRKGAFWEDRYHATAVQSGDHLMQCLIYIDMNMVRAGAVNQPEEWPFCGYNEIQEPRQRYALIDYKSLMDLLEVKTLNDLKRFHKRWVEESIRSGRPVRDGKWTESVAVGSKSFVEKARERLGIKARARNIIEGSGMFELREPQSPYNVGFDPENGVLTTENTYNWDTNL
jgi:putative transposase